MKSAKKFKTPDSTKINQESSPIEGASLSVRRQFIDREAAFSTLKHDIMTCRVACEVISYFFGLPDDLMSPTRGAPLNALARQVAMYISNTGFGMQMTQVALGFQRDRSTITHAAKKIEDLRDDAEFDRLLDEVGEILGQILELKQRFQAKLSDPKFIKNTN